MVNGKLLFVTIFIMGLLPAHVYAFDFPPFGFAPEPLGDLNKDNKVDNYDLALLASEWLSNLQHSEEDLLVDAEFSRNSIAYLDGKRYVPNAPRKKLMAVCEPSDLKIHLQDEVEGIGMVALSPYCEAGNYLYATSTDHKNIYRSLDGIHWQRTTGYLTTVHRIFGTRSGAILVAHATGGKIKIYRSISGGADLMDFSLPPPSLVLPGDNYTVASLEFWNYHQSRNGTICISEYGYQGGFKESKIYRSTDDGITFTQVYDEPDNVYHSHRIYKHEASGRWINVYGDGESRNKIVKSDDDGLTWSTLDPQMDNHFQPVELLDYGHPENLLYGSDENGFIGTFNVFTREFNPLYADGDRKYPYVFTIFYHNGIFYAGTSSPHPNLNDRTTAILVSTDLEHWAVYHQFRNKEYGVRKFVGYRNEKIHGIVYGSDNSTLYHFSFSPTKVQNVLGLCLDPSKFNMLDSEQSSSAETDTSQWTSYDQMERITTDSVHGGACLRISASYSGYATYPKAKAVSVGNTYSGRIFLKANGQNVTGRVNWYIYGTMREGRAHYFALNHQDWTEIVLEPITIEPNETHITMHIRPRSYTWLGPYDYLIDAAQYELAPPSRWQAGGTSRSDDVLHKAVTVPDKWQNVLVWSPECRSEWYAGSQKQYIKSWYKDDANYAELSFDPNESTFCLQVVQNKIPLPTVRTKPFTFYRNSIIRFEFNYSGSTIDLNISCTGLTDKLSISDIQFLNSAELNSIFGNRYGMWLMSCTVLSDKLYSIIPP